MGSTKRSLLIATAGHVDHGKSTFIKTVTGQDPDRLPEEKRRGMTLDLGFVHWQDISFVDCPGHDGLVKHLVSGQNSVDGACLIVAANEGIQEQTLEHARILRWLGIQKILVVVTKTDLACADLFLYDEIRGLFSSQTTLDFLPFSRSQCSSEVIEKIKTFFIAETEPESYFFNRFFMDRAFLIKGTGTVVTGSFSEGSIKKGDRPLLWFADGKKSRQVSIKSIRHDQKEFLQWNQIGRLALALGGVHPDELPRGSTLLFTSSSFSLAQSLALQMDWIDGHPPKKNFTGILQVGTIAVQAQFKCHPLGFWRCHLEAPAPLRRLDKVIVRVPQRIAGVGHTIGGGIILDAYLPSPVRVSPPLDKDLYGQWCFKTNPIIGGVTLAERIGCPVEKVIPQAAIPALKHEPASPVVIDESLESFLSANPWQGHVEKHKMQAAHDLVKAGRAFHIKDDHFLHKSWREALLVWLNDHFSKRDSLEIEDARTFFKVGRKSFLDILEFCDRHQWTFRKGPGRKKFKLPSSGAPSHGPPKDGHANDQRPGPLRDPC